MTLRETSSNRLGVSLTEILIGIMVLGIGVISLATLFPLGLLKMRRAVNDVRGKVLAENAWNEVRIYNLLAPPFGPPAAYFSRYPYVTGSAWPGPGWAFPVTANRGLGLPVIIDPFYILENPSRPDRYRFGHVDYYNSIGGLPIDQLPDADAPYGEGILRVPGFFLPGADGRPGWAGTDDDGNGITDGVDFDGSGNIDSWEFDPGELGWPGSDDVSGLTAEWAASLFASPDDLEFGDSPERRMIPVQDPVPSATAPPFLLPTNGVPFGPSLAGPDGISGTPDDYLMLLRNRRYTWIVIARKVSARQGLGIGTDGNPGRNGQDDDGINGTDDMGELGWYGSDDTIVDGGANGVTAPLCPQNLPVAASILTADDPARDMVTGLPVAGPAGPFIVTVVVFYGRSTGVREVTFANHPASSGALPAMIFKKDVNLAVLQQRSDGIPFPEIPLNSFIMDTTFDSRPPNQPGPSGIPVTDRRNGFVYRVVAKTLTVDPTTGLSTLTLELDQPARENGYALTLLKGAVAVFEKEVP